MNTKINHIKNLIHFAYADGHLHDKELDFIKKVGTRLGLEEVVIEKEIENRSNLTPPLPENEVLRFILFDDILNTIIADSKITQEEIKECKRVAEHMGFETAMVDAMIDKIKNHIENGFIKNSPSQFVKSELYSLTQNTINNAKFN